MSMLPTLQETLRQLVPRGHHAECQHMREVRVTGVYRVANMNLWRQYSLKRQQIGQALRTRHSCPRATDICPELLTLQRALPHVDLDTNANEVLLLHGTSRAEDIAHQG